MNNHTNPYITDDEKLESKLNEDRKKLEQLQVETPEAKYRRRIRNNTICEAQLIKSVTEIVESASNLPTEHLLNNPSNSECVSPPNEVEGNNHNVFNLIIPDYVRNTHANANCAPTIVQTFIEFSNNYKKSKKLFSIFSFRCAVLLL